MFDGKEKAGKGLGPRNLCDLERGVVDRAARGKPRFVPER